MLTTSGESSQAAIRLPRRGTHRICQRWRSRRRCYATEVMPLNVVQFSRPRHQTGLWLLAFISVFAIVALAFTPRIPLGAGYHDFADKRTILAIPNCLDVLSNCLFLIVGLWGVSWLLGASSKFSFILQKERIPYLVFFLGVVLTGLGSAWYHLDPGNSRLPWDLLPMTLSFMSMMVAVIIERVSIKLGFCLYIPLLLLGIASVVYWHFTEMQGRGDYRFYLFVQFFPPILLALIVLFFPPRYTAANYLVVAFLFFVAAKLFEALDKRIYSAAGVISGHALKHLTAGVACYWILRMLQCRTAIRPLNNTPALFPLEQFAGDGAIDPANVLPASFKGTL